MKPIIEMLKELKGEVTKIILLESLLNSVLVFLLFYLGLVLINIWPLIAFIPGLITFFFFYITKQRNSSLRQVEKKNPVVKEMLRTAADNIDNNNIMAQALNKEVLQKMRLVSTSTFFNIPVILYKIISISLIFFLAMFFASSNIHILDASSLIKGLGFLPDKTLGSDEGLYGDESLAKLSDEQQPIELNPLSFEINLDKIQNAPEKQFKSQFPKEVFISSEKAYQENIPKEQQEIVKRYFDKINK